MPRGRSTGKIFVVGPPRSGTTVLGNLLGTHPDIAYFGEFFAFFFSSITAVSVLKRVPSPVRDRYLKELEGHAGDFAQRVHTESGRPYFCDSTPWNSLIALKLSTQFPEAVFVVTIRHHVAVIQSLVRSFNNGYRMTANTNVARATLWAQCYNELVRLPKGRVILVDYDRLCIEPEQTIQRLLRDVNALLNLDADRFDLSVLTKSYVTNPGDARETIAVPDRDGSLAYRAKRNYDATTWSASEDHEVRDIVRPTLQLLAGAFPSTLLAAESLQDGTHAVRW